MPTRCLTQLTAKGRVCTGPKSEQQRLQDPSQLDTLEKHEPEEEHAVSLSYAIRQPRTKVVIRPHASAGISTVFTSGEAVRNRRLCRWAVRSERRLHLWYCHFNCCLIRFTAIVPHSRHSNLRHHQSTFCASVRAFHFLTARPAGGSSLRRFSHRLPVS